MLGKMVSEDNYISRALGRLYHTKGKSYPSDMILVVYFFIDHASGYVIIDHQVVIHATEIFREKLIFDMEDQIQVVMINIYHTDNGILNTSKFMEEMLKK